MNFILTKSVFDHVVSQRVQFQGCVNGSQDSIDFITILEVMTPGIWKVSWDLGTQAINVFVTVSAGVFVLWGDRVKVESMLTLE